MLSADELLAGGALDYEIVVPGAVLRPGGGQSAAGPDKVRLRPLTVHDLQLVTRAAKENDTLTATLMVQRALVEPELNPAQVGAMHAGLLHYLLDQVNQISGISASGELVQQAVSAPLSRAAFVLAREFGWTPQQVGELTLGQVLLNLEMLDLEHQGGVGV
jgi:hypothetical protein